MLLRGRASRGRRRNEFFVIDFWPFRVRERSRDRDNHAVVRFGIVIVIVGSRWFGFRIRGALSVAISVAIFALRAAFVFRTLRTEK